jgi:hypothetical protein
MVAPIAIGGGITIGGAISIGTGSGSSPPADPATNTGGISLAVIAGLPQTLYPAVNVYSGTYNAKFIINPASTYGTPSGFTFLSSWSWAQFDPTYVSVTTTTNTDDTAIALTNANNAVLGSYGIAPGTKRMFSVTHTTWSGGADYDGVGVGSSTTDYTGSGKFLGFDNQAVSIYDDGNVWTNYASVASGYEIFETNGQIIDVAVDTVNNKMWYRVAGGAWQG